MICPRCQVRNPRRNSAGCPVRHRAFSLLELLVSCAVFIVILAVVTGMMTSASSLWLKHRSQSVAFEAANAAFSTLTRSLAQAVLNTYWEVRDSSYGRSSELHFTMGPATGLLGQASTAKYPGDAVFFQAALGRPADTALKRLPFLLNSVGYFVRFDDGPPIPSFLTPFTKPRHRYRLYEWLQPTENFRVYNPPDSSTNGQRAWFRTDLTGTSMTNTALLAENVIGLILLAEYPDANGNIVPVYAYDSRDTTSAGSLHQLPPRIRVLMAVIDEPSALRLSDQYGEGEPPIYPEATWFKNPAEFDADLVQWEERLKSIQPRIDYRIFTTTVVIQNAKWSLSL